MHCVRSISDSLMWIGGSDRRLSLFENLFPIPQGVSYNSYLILDEKTAVLDTVDSSISHQFMENLSHGLNGRPLDYLILNHMEPDHCATIQDLFYRFPNMVLVGNAKTFTILKQFHRDMDLTERTLVVKEGDTLTLGKHTLQFFMAPMVHWPEVMLSYEQTTGTLFSADAFGSFGALDGAIFDDELDLAKQWLAEGRRYYGNIVGKYALQIQSALKKLSGLTIKTICPLHGIIWRSNLNYLLEKYSAWSSYTAEEKAVAIFYGSMYGNTQNAANYMAHRLGQLGVTNVAVYDVSKTDVSYMISEIFRCSHLVFASPTYNNGIYPSMDNLLHDMQALGLQNRTIGLIENGTWAPTCGKSMQAALASMKNMTQLEPMVAIRSSVSEENRETMDVLCQNMLESM